MPAQPPPGDGHTPQTKSVAADAIVYLVDDDSDQREALGLLLSSVSIPVQTFASAADFLNALPNDPVGCAVLDVRMPGMSGIELQKRLIAAGSRLPIIILTAFGEVPMVVDALRDGAFDFLTKPVSPQKVVARINAALQLDTDQRVILERQRCLETGLNLLTPRERDVLHLLMAGQHTKQIAANLGVGTTTIDYHRANVLEKMNSENVTVLVRDLATAFGSEFFAALAVGTH